MTCIQAILTLWLAQPQCWLDRHESVAQRSELYRPVAAAVCAATEGVNGRAFLARQAYEETKLCRAVVEFRCRDMPAGQRCDDGAATTVWQIHRWCPKAWSGTHHDRLLAGAQCALLLAGGGFKRCGTWQGAFAAQRGTGRCKAPWAATRSKLHARDAWRLKRLMEEP